MAGSRGAALALVTPPRVLGIVLTTARILDTHQHTHKEDRDPILRAADNNPSNPSNGNPTCMSVTGMSVRQV